jgi:4-amino-4-deoxy-L-arabinose transferase-like glycosyltransferase
VQISLKYRSAENFLIVMVSKEQIARMMKEALPKCPICGSDSGYEVTSVIKGYVKCKSCGSEWFSRDFILSDKVSKLKINRLPNDVYSCTVNGQVIKRCDEHPLSFWRVLRESQREKYKSVKMKTAQFMEFSAVFILSLMVLLPGFTTHDVGWDEPIYVFAGRAYVEALFRRDFFGDVWQWNHEHPPLAKYIYGASSLALTPLLGNPYFGARISTSLMSSLIVAMVYVFSKNIFGGIVGILASAALTLTPFYYGMSRYVSLDLPVTFFTCAYLLLFYLGIRKEKAALIFLSSILFGLAGSVKVSGFSGLLVIALWLIAVFKRRILSMVAYYWRKKPGVFLSLVFYPIIGIIVLILSWPWLWTQTIERLVGSDGVLTYAYRFKMWGHEEFFEGEVIWHPPPYYYFYYLAVKTPIPTLFFLIIGFMSLINSRMRLQYGEALTLIVLWFIAPLLLQTYQQPYDALRPILVIFPPMAIIAALGAHQIILWITEILSRVRKVNLKNKEKRNYEGDFLIVLIVSLILIASSVLAILRVSPYEIAYFNELAGDSNRIMSTFESSFWAEGLGGAVDYINRFASYGATISIIGELEAFNQFHREDLRIVGYVPPSELRLFNVEYVVFQGFYLQHFVWENRTMWGGSSSALDLWSYLLDNGELFHVVKAGNAPLVWIFKVKG